MSANNFNTDHGDGGTQIAGKKRFVIFAVFFALIGLGLLVRYGYLMLFPWQSTRQSQTERLAGRGLILDRNGRLLALETRLGNVTLWRPQLEDVEILGRELAPLLEQTPEELRNRINNTQGDFIYLKRQVNESVIRQIEDKISQGLLRGVGIEPTVGRIYPEKNLAAQIIGFVGNDNNGLEGIEFAFDRELRPGQGNQTIGANRTTGSQVFLTLDVNVQYILETIADQVMRENRAEAVILTAMDPRTGDILGSASTPGFDPNDLRNYNEVIHTNRPATMSYEPGSVFKIFSISALMDTGAISDDTFFTCNGYYERVTARGETIRISCLGAHGNVSPREIIIYSCNAGAAYAADRLGVSAFNDKIREFGFGTRTGAGSPGETAGFLRPTERWSERSKPTIAMGQEISVSAFQMLKAATAVANDGVLVSPRIVSRIVSADGKTVRNFEPDQPRRVLSVETARAMRSYMVDTTSNIGTAWRANVQDLSLAVKTGTAQLIDPATGRYSDTDFIASCIALLPAESPSLVLYLAIVKPHGDSYLGGRIAAPPIREAAEALINYLGIPRGRNPQIVHSGAISIPAIPYPAVNEIVPDFTGAAKRLLLPLLLRDDLNLQVYGDGWVVRQNPAPGTPLRPDTVIILELE